MSVEVVIECLFMYYMPKLNEYCSTIIITYLLSEISKIKFVENNIYGLTPDSYLTSYEDKNVLKNIN